MIFKLRKRHVRVCKLVRVVRVEKTNGLGEGGGFLRACLFDRTRKTGRQIVRSIIVQNNRLWLISELLVLIIIKIFTNEPFLKLPLTIIQMDHWQEILKKLRSTI